MNRNYYVYVDGKYCLQWNNLTTSSMFNVCFYLSFDVLKDKHPVLLAHGKYETVHAIYSTDKRMYKDNGELTKSDNLIFLELDNISTCEINKIINDPTYFPEHLCVAARKKSVDDFLIGA